MVEASVSNTPPAIAGAPPTAVTAGNSYSFLPEGSDADGDALTFIVSNPPAWATFTAGTGELSGTPSAADVGTYTDIVISVSDGQDESALPPFTITVASVGVSNAPPAISGMPSGTVTAGQIYTFTPTASDPDGNPLTFEITNLPAWAHFNTANGKIDGTPTAGHVGAYDNISIKVSDGQASTSLAPFKVTVAATPSSNSLPTISGTPPTTVTAGQSYEFTPTAADADGDPLTFSVTNLPGWARFDTSNGRISGTPTAAHVGTYNGIRIRVGDGQANASLAPFKITVRAANRAPVISGNPPTFTTQGQGYSFTPTATDADGNTLTFSISNLPSWTTFNTSTGRLEGTPAAANVGSYANIVITVSDGQTTAALAPFGITVQATNRAPVISGSPATTVSAGQGYSFVPTASDPDGNSLTFGIVNRPPWATFNTTTGRLEGTPAAANVGASSSITISVSDGQASAALAAFTITVQSNNRPPVISGSPATAVTSGQSYSFTPTASDPDGNALTFSVVNRPSWATLNSSTGVLSGTPAAANVGTYSNISIRVSDGQATTSLAAFSITVQAANRAPLISGTPPATVVAGQGYAFTPTANDADGNTLTFSISNRPTWATFNSNTGALTGTTTAANVGTYSNIAISVSDGQTTASLAAFGITVQAAANRAPIISGSAPASVTSGQPYSFTPTASDPDGNTLSFSIANRPTWATFNSSTGALGGTPTAANVGTHSNISISVSDGQASVALAAFSITVQTGNRAPVISGSPPTTAMADQPYAFTPSSSDPDGNTLTFTVSNLPGWASFNAATGRISGTPTSAHVGVYTNIAITVSDGQTGASLPPFAITVTAITTGSVRLSWTPPTSNSDGSPLTNFAGYRIYWGTSPTSFSNSETVNNAGLASYVVEQLPPATWFFVVTAVNSQGGESSFSNVASKTIQ